jgi:hypothetical protein
MRHWISVGERVGEDSEGQERVVDHFFKDGNNRHTVLLQQKLVDIRKRLPETNTGV